MLVAASLSCYFFLAWLEIVEIAISYSVLVLL